jgi:tetratricopeptide (TPR) repeat protein
LYAAALAGMKRIQEAKDAFERLLANYPNSGEALRWLLRYERGQGNNQAALNYAQQLVLLTPADPEAHVALGDCFLSVFAGPDAIHSYRRAIELSPQKAQLHYKLGKAYEACLLSELATESYETATKLSPLFEPAIVQLNRNYIMDAEFDKAIALMTQSVKKMPTNPSLLVELGQAYCGANRFEEAKTSFGKAIAFRPAERVKYAIALQQAGQFNEAAKEYSLLLKTGQERGMSHFGLVHMNKTVGDKAALIEELQGLLKNQLFEPIQQMYLHYALGRLYDQMGAYGDSMGAYDEANRLAFQLYNGGVAYDSEALGRGHDHVLQLLGSENDGSGLKDDIPILIVGMIRSGTTLLEQIVSSHPEVAAGGELRFWAVESAALAWKGGLTANDLGRSGKKYLAYLHRHCGAARRMTDKMPLNFLNLGIIHRALPNAKILHIRRDPLDTALSIYMTHLGPGPRFAYSKEGIVAYYRQYLSVMDKWRAELPPDRLLEIQYEDLILDRENCVRRVLDFCDLSWADECLRHEENATPVLTPSMWQARQPVYRSSIRKWAKFEPWLGQFQELRQI